MLEPLAADHRGAGHSSRPSPGPGNPADLRADGSLPRGGYTKWELAENVHLLLHDHLGLTGPAFVLGHDIGSMVATAYAFRYRDHTRALGYGEASQPGTAWFEQMKTSPTEWRFSLPNQLGMYGRASLAHAQGAAEIGRELARNVTADGIPGSGHWIAEENPAALVESLLRFDGRSPA